jgi:hypothetical protein
VSCNLASRTRGVPAELTARQRVEVALTGNNDRTAPLGQRVRYSPMPYPLCSLCGKTILATDNKMTVQDVSHHTACWDRKAARDARRAAGPRPEPV